MGAEPLVRVLMVCMGNICRSPTAEGVLRRKLQVAGLGDRVEVDSAGTHDYHVGSPPDRRSQQHAARRGYDLSSLRARELVAADFARFDLVLVMDDANHRIASRLRPAAQRCRLGYLMQFSARHAGDLEVPDPYSGGPDGFEDVLDRIESACDGLVAKWLDPVVLQSPHSPDGTS